MGQTTRRGTMATAFGEQRKVGGGGKACRSRWTCSHSTVTAQSPHSHRTVNTVAAQSQHSRSMSKSLDLQAAALHVLAVLGRPDEERRKLRQDVLDRCLLPHELGTEGERGPLPRRLARVLLFVALIIGAVVVGAVVVVVSTVAIIRVGAFLGGEGRRGDEMRGERQRQRQRECIQMIV